MLNGESTVVGAIKKANPAVDYGALVARGNTIGDLAVIPGSPADKAGIVESVGNSVNNLFDFL